MDMVFALIVTVIGMGVVYIFLYILTLAMNALKFFDRLPGFKEPPSVPRDVPPETSSVTTSASEEQDGAEDGEVTEIVAAAVGAYMNVHSKDQGSGSCRHSSKRS